ncbi:NADPH-dependent 7-cyano-7-deazaguanine reductase QueF [Corticibacter populi]|uniref:NADPH-dependent 7-cyano-7-deazaguanine reductase n=1 Tax=Corticibacter populi TaxID=1550736 RepID=A0A3M6QX44_9BURK|nr:NADPH-dependent 7-cyano-7-deazaguanine reductase QueF [Corticibacter populi]RMX07586.1 NADPH-dependent 7-cyano-7-deazaguanine reductase QueF [Corticibacter populi]RZS30083.1 7-cyano-7-deazaguanine reductase [Corticibacter populi]
MNSSQPDQPIPADLPLGREVAYPGAYDPGLLFPIARAAQRAELGLDAARLPFVGADVWTAFELSWLNPHGKPQVGVAHFTFPAETPNIIESKSFKLYLNSLNNAVFADTQALRERLRADLSEAAWRGSESGLRSIGVRIVEAAGFDAEPMAELDGLDLDRLDVECTHYLPAPELLGSRRSEALVTETLTSRLLKSNCPVTGQPDWASVQIHYSGHPIDQAGLLRYIVSFRNHTGFHENCVERMFIDIWQRCQPLQLAIWARYTRRGGLDINPFRSSHPQAIPANVRTARQ